MDSSQINDFQQEPIRKVSILLGIGIFIMPYIFSWFTLREGYSKLAKIMSFTWLAVLLAMPFIAPKSENSSNYQTEKKVENIAHNEEGVENSNNEEKIESENSESYESSNEYLKNNDSKYTDINSIGNKVRFFDIWKAANSSDGTAQDIFYAYTQNTDFKNEFEKKDAFESIKSEIEDEMEKYEDIKYISIPIIDQMNYPYFSKKQSNFTAFIYPTWHIFLNYNFEKQGFSLLDKNSHRKCFNNQKVSGFEINSEIECFMQISEDIKVPNIPNERLALLIKKLDEANLIVYTGRVYAKLDESSSYKKNAEIEILGAEIELKIREPYLDYESQEKINELKEAKNNIHSIFNGDVIYRFKMGDF